MEISILLNPHKTHVASVSWDAQESIEDYLLWNSIGEMWTPKVKILTGFFCVFKQIL